MDTISVLIIEDNQGDARLIEEYLRLDLSVTYSIHFTSTLADSLLRIRGQKFDIILVDLGLPDSQGMSTFDEIVSINPRSPIVIITGVDNENLGIEAIRKGALNYLPKNQVNAILLNRTIKHSIQLKRINEELFETREKYKSIFEEAPNMILSLDSEGIILDCNNRTYLLLGYTKDELVGQSFTKMFYPASAEKATQSLREIFKTGLICSDELKMARKNGEEVTVLVNSSVLNNSIGEELRAYCIIEDITGRKRLEEEIRVSEVKHRTLFETMLQGVIYQAADGAIISANKASERILGLTLDQMMGRTSFDPRWKAIHEDGSDFIGEAHPSIEALKTGKEISNVVMGIFNPQNERTTWINVNAVPQFVAGESIAYQVYTTFEDITDRKIIEQELISAKEKAEESDKLKTAFLRNISHEIRTPLNAIVGFSSLLDNPRLSIEKQRSFIETINRSSDHLLAIVNDVVEFSNIEAGILQLNKDEFNLNTIMNDLYNRFNTLISGKSLEFGFDIGLSDPAANIITDVTKLTQILSNLTNNALKFTSQGKINIGYSLIDGNIQFHVSDTGIGISEDKFTKIFDRFYQVEHSEARLCEGTGLGLSICKAYAELLGGKMWVTSTQNEGSTFFFTIPYDIVKNKNIGDHHISEEKNSEVLTTKIVLVAEDDVINFELVRELLSDLNIKVRHALTGSNAIQLCKIEPPDLILMDLRMPDMDGFEATKRIKEFLPDIPVIALTAYSTEIDRNKAFSCGCSDFVTKPFTRKVLISKINEHLFR